MPKIIKVAERQNKMVELCTRNIANFAQPISAATQGVGLALAEACNNPSFKALKNMESEVKHRPAMW